MISQCPHCKGRFKVSREQLQAANGTVRCGDCGNPFDAIANESRTPTSDDAEQITSQWFSELLGDGSETASARNAPSRTQKSPVQPRQASAQNTLAQNHPLQKIGQQPIELLQSGRRATLAATLPWGIGTLLLAALLIFQWYLASQPAGWQPASYLVTACHYLYCPPAQPVGGIEATSVRITAHPQRAGALLVDASLFNNAEQALAAPLLALQFSDLEGELVARREFRPEEYLGGELLGQANIPAQTTVYISLEIVDPGEEAVNYTVDLLPAAR